MVEFLRRAGVWMGAALVDGNVPSGNCPVSLGFLRRREKMPRGPRHSGRAGRIALAVACTIFAVAGASPFRRAHATSSPLRYVALGDSSAPPPVSFRRTSPRRPSACARPALPARHRAEAERAAHRCDLRSSRDPALLQLAVLRRPPQLNAVNKYKQLVTMTIGGNDSGVFINAILTAAPLASRPLAGAAPARTVMAPRLRTRSATRHIHRS